MTVLPVVPTLDVAGTAVGTGTTGSLVAIGSLRIKWGRPTLLVQPTPATATVTVLDRSAGYTFANRTDLIGQVVKLGWAADGWTTPDGPPSAYNFRGRVTDVTVAWRPRLGAMVVVLDCSSKEVDAGNYVVPKSTTWPAETFTARLSRINALLPALYFAGGPPSMPTRDAVGLTDVADPSKDFGDYTAAQMDVSGQDALSLLRQFYNSVYPVPLTYDPYNDRLVWAARRTYAFNNALGRVAAVGMVRLPGGSSTSPYVPVPLTSVASWAFELDGAREVGYSGDLEQTLDSRITRVEVTFRDSTAAYASATAAAATTLAGDEVATGRRTLSVDSIHATTAIAAQLATSWATMAGAEGARRRLGDLEYSTARAPFRSLNAILALLAGYETGAQAFVRGTWLTRLGARPLFGLLGGTIAYADGEWTSTFTPAPVSVASPYTPVTVGAAPAGLKLADVDTSVAVGDFAFIDSYPGA